MIYIYYRHPFVNREGKFSVLKLATGKYDLIEREEIDERLKKLSYKMIKPVMIYICLNLIYIYIYNFFI
jgi:phage FluMu gp28-like protein